MWLARSSLPSTFNFKMTTALAPDESTLQWVPSPRTAWCCERDQRRSPISTLLDYSIPVKVTGHPCPRPASELPLWWAVVFLIHTSPSFWQTMKASNREKHAGEQTEQGMGFLRRFSTVAKIREQLTRETLGKDLERTIPLKDRTALSV